MSGQREQMGNRKRSVRREGGKTIERKERWEGRGGRKVIEEIDTNMYPLYGINVRGGGGEKVGLSSTVDRWSERVSD